MTRRRLLTSTSLAWLPVACLLGLTLLAPPGATEPRVSGSLSFSPKEFYGGQALTFSGTTGRSGKQKIWLELNENRKGDDWVKIEGSGATTDSSGHFRFQFPARGMNNILVRVASARTVTPPVLFQAHDQAVSLAVHPADGTLYDPGPCRASFIDFISYDAVAGEPFRIDVDATPEGEPPLQGRKVTLQKRTGTSWTRVGDSLQLDKDGEASFDVSLGSADPTAYRVVLGDITTGVNQIGWFPSFPTYVDPLHRPDPAVSATVGDPAAGDLNPTDLLAQWALPADPTIGKVVVAWKKGGAPSSLDDADDSTVVDPAGQALVDDLVPDEDYGFAVLTRSTDGICAPAITATGHTEPTPPATGVHVTGTDWNHVDLAWTLPDIPPDQIDQVKVRRAPGSPPTSPAGGVQFPVAPDATSYSDTDVEPSTSYGYSVFVQVNTKWSIAASTTVTTPPEPQP